jgi:hypothetical protein
VIGVQTSQTVANLEPDDKAQPLPQGISSTVEELVTITHNQDPELNATTQARPEEHSDPASENVGPLSHHNENSAKTPSVPIPQQNEPVSQRSPGLEIVAEPLLLPVPQSDEPESQEPPVSEIAETTANTTAFPNSQNDEPVSQGPPESDTAEAPSIAALSVDSEERDDDSALGGTSI